MSSEILNTCIQLINKKIKNEYNFIFFVNKQEMVLKKKSLQDLEKEIDQSISKNQNDIECLVIKEQILYRYLNNYKQAIQVISSILKKEEANIDARLDLIDIMLLFQVGKLDQCNNLLKECFLLDQNYWRTYVLEIRILEKMNVHDLFLLNRLSQNLNKFQDNFFFYINYFQIFSDNYKIDEKLSLKFLKLIERQYVFDFDIIRKIAYVFFNLDKQDEAFELLQQALRLNPFSFQIYENFGSRYRLNPNTQQKAIEYLKQSEKYNDRFQIIFLNMVCAYRNLKQFKLSNEYALKSLKLCQNDDNFYYYIIKNYFELGEVEKVIYFSQKTLKKFKNIKYIIKLCQRIQSAYFQNETGDYEELEEQIINSFNIKDNTKNAIYNLYISQVYQ
ncbi:hypothetical protein ABPG72_014074 [Tetrahymena utriculariae]